MELFRKLHEAALFLEERILYELAYGEILEEAEYKGEKVTLNKPSRNSGGKKKFKVYVKNDKGNVIKVTFGDKDMEIKRDDPERRKAYRARHKCSSQKDKTTAAYWSCKMWQKGTSVGDMTD